LWIDWRFLAHLLRARDAQPRVSDSPLFRTSEKGNDDEGFRAYGPFGSGLYPAWIASCSVMYLPFLVVP
jgi:hypothetical protein